jgi:hypothetical protein
MAAGLGLTLACAVPQAGHAADSLLTFGDLDKLRVYHAYSASDGKTYIEEIDMPARQAMSGGKPSVLYTLFTNPKSVAIARSTSGSMIDWHFAGENRHFMFTTQGQLVFDTGDGTLFHLPTGAAMYAEDWTGKGHRSGCLSPKGESCVVVDMILDPNPHTMPLASPPRR